MTRLYNALQQYQRQLDNAPAGGAARRRTPWPAEARVGGPVPVPGLEPAHGPIPEPVTEPILGPIPEPVQGPTADLHPVGARPGGAKADGVTPRGTQREAPRPAGPVHRPMPGQVSRLITTKLPRESLIALYGSIEQRLSPDTPRIVQVTSATKGEGTSTVARDLAVTIADSVRKRVLLISVIRPGVNDFAMAAPMGLEAVMTGSANQGDVIEAVPGLPLFETTLSAVGAGNGHLFDAPAMDRALRSALGLVDLVILDTPPVLNGFVAAALARHCGGTVLVVEAERVRAPKVEEARRTIEAHGGRVIGAVMNKRRWHIPGPIYRRLQ
ncbi:CpsD/CapB family tyrosine-protein kinase [Desertibaculum subflavum]|uniref:CpsD/CapB family tyrosine-protein kinase n=1 Tax=Desertibaculum subflavum TaxID=2268458 RepID=UPI0013C479EF